MAEGCAGSERRLWEGWESPPKEALTYSIVTSSAVRLRGGTGNVPSVVTAPHVVSVRLTQNDLGVFADLAFTVTL